MLKQHRHVPNPSSFSPTQPFSSPLHSSASPTHPPTHWVIFIFFQSSSSNLFFHLAAQLISLPGRSECQRGWRRGDDDDGGPYTMTRSVRCLMWRKPGRSPLSWERNGRWERRPPKCCKKKKKKRERQREGERGNEWEGERWEYRKQKEEDGRREKRNGILRWEKEICCLNAKNGKSL